MADPYDPGGRDCYSGDHWDESRGGCVHDDTPGGGSAGDCPGGSIIYPASHPEGICSTALEPTEEEDATARAAGGDAFGQFKMPDWSPYKFDFNFGDAPGFTARRFQAPKPEDILNDPSYKWRLGQSLDALQNSAASRGVARTGNTAKGLIDYAGNSASQEYGNAYDRAYKTYGLDYQADRDEYFPKYATWQQGAQGKQRAQELSAAQIWQKYLSDLNFNQFLLSQDA